MPAYASRPVAVVTGASSGLGFAIAKAFLQQGYDVVGIARDAARLEQAANAWELIARSGPPTPARFLTRTADVIDATAVKALFQSIGTEFGRIDVLVNAVGQSDRGSVETLKAERLSELLQSNVIGTLLCSQAALPHLENSRGVIINIGSLAAKVGARHLGAYPAAKHALAGLTQQMRLEWRDRGVHVALLSPGPIRRDDAGQRYKDLTTPGIPDQAMQPGGGTSLKGLDPDWIARQVVQCAKRRTPDIVLPRYVRLMIAIGHLWPAIGDRLLLAMTSKR